MRNEWPLKLAVFNETSSHYPEQTNYRLPRPTNGNHSPLITRTSNQPSVVHKSSTKERTQEITPNWVLKRPTNTPCEVLITNCTAPWKIYLRYCHYEDKLKTLMEEIQISATNADPVQSLINGLFCLALYRNGRWYRVQIVTVGRTSIYVRSMDYGWGWPIPTAEKNKRIRNIENRLLRENPFFAFDVKLSGITPIGKNLKKFSQQNAWWCKLKSSFWKANNKFLMEIVDGADTKSVRLMTLDGKNVITSTFQEGEIDNTNR